MWDIYIKINTTKKSDVVIEIDEIICSIDIDEIFNNVYENKITAFIFLFSLIVDFE